jgi:hypothetical protein
MSIIVVAAGYSECLRWTLDRLRAQTIASELECILVTRSKGGLALAADAARGLHSLRVVEDGAMDDAGRAKAAGVRVAKAPLVAFVEDHSYPDPGWAEALVKAYASAPVAAVGPVVLNANPNSHASWGCFLVYYGMFMQAQAPEHVRHLPGNQSSYRKEVLLAYGSRLPDMMQAEFTLQAELRAAGMALRQEPAAKVFHLNYSRIGPAVREYYLASRVFAAQRRHGWAAARRLLYVCGSPLLPLIRVKRILAQARAAGLSVGVTAGALAPAMLILCAGAAGESLGYALGPGGAKAALMRFEREHAGLFTARDLEAISLSPGLGPESSRAPGRSHV